MQTAANLPRVGYGKAPPSRALHGLRRWRNGARPWAPSTLHPTTRARAGAGEESELESAVKRWQTLDQWDSTRKELTGLLSQPEKNRAELEDRLCSALQFGTAGLRAKMGVGFNRMNQVTVCLATQGLYEHLVATVPEAAQRGVAIAFDARYLSEELAQLVATTLLAKGMKVYLFNRYVPTPILAFAVATCGCAAGVMVTASHNPKEYNGYKVYWENGCQIIPPMDTGIAAAIAAQTALWPRAPLGGDLLVDPTDAVLNEYFVALQTHLRFLPVGELGEAGEAGQREESAEGVVGVGESAWLPTDVVYSAMHGVGCEHVERAFAAFQLPPPLVVVAQAEPDPEFPTVEFPNPEEGGTAWTLALQMADDLFPQKQVDLVLANDPDADRLAVCVFVLGGDIALLKGALPSSRGWGGPAKLGCWRPLTGNEIGLLLAHWVWTNWCESHPNADASQVVMLASTVSSRALAAMAEVEGFEFVETLTGFKWLGNVTRDLEAQGRTVLFAYEEAIGFMFPQVVHDKDGVAAAAVFAEMTRALARQGVTPYQHLNRLYQRYGCHITRAHYMVAPTPDVSRSIFTRFVASAISTNGMRWRTRARLALLLGLPASAWKPLVHGDCHESVGEFRIVAIKDVGQGTDTGHPSGEVQLPWAEGDMHLHYTVAVPGGFEASVTLRASGTEPKLKYYIEVVHDDWDMGNVMADQLEEATIAHLLCPQLSGLQPAPQL